MLSAESSSPAPSQGMYKKDKEHFEKIRKDIKAEIGKFISIIIREANTPDIKEYTKGAVYCGTVDKYMAVVDSIAKDKNLSFKRMSGKEIGYCIINIAKIRAACVKAGLSKEETNKIIDMEMSLTKQYLNEFVEKSIYINSKWKRSTTSKGVMNVWMVMKHIHLPS